MLWVRDVNEHVLSLPLLYTRRIKIQLQIMWPEIKADPLYFELSVFLVVPMFVYYLEMRSPPGENMFIKDKTFLTLIGCDLKSTVYVL